ncbi:recombinase family protein [Burkholderia ubonensis]|uniref:recombinase family protein n=1 Tax=Burkholderia ubonensis TaxID=101571 RepID=UPI0009B43FB7|nr:recombinase family protein [Burkholderia ubonensis]
MSARSNSQVSNQIDIRSGSSQHIRLPAIPCRAWFDYVLHVRLITECISGSVSADQRPGFSELLLKMEDGDVLIVTKLDRLGRNAMDVRATVELLADRGIRIHCLALGGVDLTSAAGRMTMQVLNAVAEFERDLLIERTQAGIARAKSEGKTMGRPAALSRQQQAEVRKQLGEGASVASVARQHGTSRQTIMRIRDSA